MHSLRQQKVAQAAINDSANQKSSVDLKIAGRALGLMVALAFAWCGTALLRVKHHESAVVRALPTYTNLIGDPARGEYVAWMAGCIACHTDTEAGGQLMAGGPPIQTPFGTFYAPNLTPDRDNGIGGWTTEDFVMAMTLGLSPAGDHYFPSFPYTSYTAMLPQDLVDLEAWLSSLEPAGVKSRAHNLKSIAANRSLVTLWKALFFSARTYSDSTDRGRYLVSGPGHCRECHAPRNRLGGLTTDVLSGNARGPGGHAVPGITAGDLREWEIEDLELFLEVGITPSGDFTGGHMADVIEYGTGRLTSEDRSMIANYLLSSEN